MLRSTRRALLAATALVVVVALPAQAITFGPTRRASAPNAWNPGKALAATPTRLLSIWASDCPPPTGECATDNGPHMAVFVSRSPAGAAPAHFGRPMRLSPKDAHAERPSISADGDTVIASYVTQKRYRNYDPGVARAVWVRVSVNGGDRWRPRVRLSAGGTRVDYPRVAISGGRLFTVWTVAETGQIRLAWSDDLGATWSKADVGTTTATPGGVGEGVAGYPDIGARGSNVAVAWIASDDGSQVAVTSSTGGADLTGQIPVALTGSSPNDGQHYPAVAGAVDPADPRVAIAYTTASGLEIRLFDGVTLGAATTVLTWPVIVGGVRYVGGYGPAVLPASPTRLAIALAVCRRVSQGNPCDPSRSGVRIDIVYTASSDGGMTWETPQRLTDAANAPYRTNDEPSLAVTGARERVAFDRYQAGFSDYDMWLRSSV